MKQHIDPLHFAASDCVRSFALALLSVGLFAPSSFAADDEKPAKKAVVAAPDKDEKDTSKADNDEKEKDKDDGKKWTELFNRKDLEGWKVTQFGGQGDVSVVDGELIIEMGADLSGVHTERELPKSNYEIEVQVMRKEGGDFFCGLTFPVGEDPCSLIIGGWGGGVCGLSSLDGFDASENQTTSYHGFKSGEWHNVRLQVTDDVIQAWLDDKELVWVMHKDHKISVRFEVELSRPLGLATYQTTSHVRRFRIRELTKEDLKKSQEELESRK